MFNERKKYKNEVYPIYTVPTPYDLWYDKTKSYFGRLDQNGYPIIAREKYLKQATGSVNAFALDFVVDAYSDFKKKYTFLNKKLSDGTAFKELNVKSGWKSAPVDYDEYLDGVFKLFVENYMSQEKRDQKLIDFRSFLSMFYKFIKDAEGNVPITFSSFIKSPYCSPQSSGLIIEFATDPHGNDKDKYNNFIKNICFECYARTAAEFGFRIDKNYPGRIIADLKSTKMQEYMGAYPKQPQQPDTTPPTPPTFELPDVSQTTLESPWQAGDTVEAVIIKPKSPSTDPYYIIGGYTDPRNQKFGAGVRPIIRDEINGERIDAYQFMVDTLIEAGRATKVFFKLLNPQVPSSGFSNNLPSDQPTWQATIIGVENSFPGGLKDFFPNYGIGNIRMEYLVYSSRLVRLISNGIGLSPGISFSIEAPFEQGGIIYMRQLPLDSVCLSNAVQQPSSTIKRFEKYFQERLDIASQEERIREYRTFTYEPLYEKYEEELRIYNQSQENYQAQLELYNTLPKPMSYNNIIDSRYNLGYRVDIDMIKELLLQFYYSYSSSRPTVFITEEVKCGTNTPRTKRRTLQREQISKRIIEQKYPDRRFWIKTYAEIKRLEMKDKIKPDVFNKILYTTITLFNSKGEETALKYLTDEFIKYN
jgi:hypothetical protein